MHRHRPRRFAHVADFIPDREQFLDGDGARRFAEARLCEWLVRLIWKAVQDERPRILERMALITDLTRADWRRDPVRALQFIAEVRTAWEQAFSAARDSGMPADAIPTPPITSIYLDAGGTYLRYTAALVRMKLMAPPDLSFWFTDSAPLLTGAESPLESLFLEPAGS